MAADEGAIVARVNAVRERAGFTALRVDPVLARIAREHSRQMAEQGSFSHDTPGGVTLVDRITRAGLPYHLVGENIFRARGMDDVAGTAVKGWMASPGHRANILRPGFTETGVGVWKRGDRWWATQDFLRP